MKSGLQNDANTDSKMSQRDRGYQLSSIDPVKDGLVASLKGDGLFGGEVEAAGYRGRA